jgi:hypothetical protein
MLISKALSEDDEQLRRSDLALPWIKRKRSLDFSKDRFSFNACLGQQDHLLVRMLVGGLRVLVGMLTMLFSRRSVYFRLFMLTNIVMMCRFKVVMGGCLMMCGSSVMVLAGSVLLFFRHLNRHVYVLLQKMIRFGTEQNAPI